MNNQNIEDSIRQILFDYQLCVSDKSENKAVKAIKALLIAERTSLLGEVREKIKGMKLKYTMTTVGAEHNRLLNEIESSLEDVGGGK